ncbi:MAG TPA: CD225/dispanin family protein [bacterium]|nr:CD225/dispanin family protein [bacterium]
MFCPRCGARNEDDARFCINCGATIEQFAPVPKPEAETGQPAAQEPIVVPPQQTAQQIPPPPPQYQPQQGGFQQTGYQQQPVYQQPPVSPAAGINDYLTHSIIVTIASLSCCCFGCPSIIVGIIAIYFASKSRNAKIQGNFVAAQEAANTARILCMIGVGLLVIAAIVMFINYATGNINYHQGIPQFKFDRHFRLNGI